MQEIFLARQPILDHRENLFGFELLFRRCDSDTAHCDKCDTADILDGASATAQVVVNAFGEMGFLKVLGAHKGFINLDTQFLHSDLVELLPCKRVVLELLETIVIDESVVRRCKELKRKGYTLALDDVACLGDDIRPLLEIVDIVKLDLLQIEVSELPSLVSALKRYPVKLLAEKVESREQAKYCLGLGFDMLQGYYFARPEMISGKSIRPSEMALLRILALMMEEADSAEIVQVFKEHPNLAYNLLRMVNSAASGLAIKISSINHGLMALGRQPLLRWLQLMLYSSEQSKGMVSPLMQLAATRGKLMELIALQDRHVDHDYVERSFMAGILSLLDTLFCMPLPEVLSHMNVHEEVEMALLKRAGPIGEYLTWCELLEQGNVEALQRKLQDHPLLTIGSVNTAQMEALAWVNSIAA